MKDHSETCANILLRHRWFHHLVPGQEFHVRLFQQDGLFVVTYSNAVTQLESLEFTDKDAAFENYRTICDVIEKVLTCLRGA